MLTILALIGMAPASLTAIAAIAIGSGLLVEAFAIAAKWQSLRLATDTHTMNQEVEMEGGLTAETVGGVGGTTLGILALLGGPAGDTAGSGSHRIRCRTRVRFRH